MTDLELAATLTAALAGAGALVTAIIEMLKATVFPAAWHTGRAPMVAAAALSLAAVLITGAQVGLQLSHPATWILLGTAWMTVYSAAIATHTTVSKAGRVLTGTTNRAGPDDAS